MSFFEGVTIVAFMVNFDVVFGDIGTIKYVFISTKKKVIEKTKIIVDKIIILIWNN